MVSRFIVFAKPSIACGVKRYIKQNQQNILGEVCDHAVAEEFAREILKKKPGKKDVQAMSPVVQYAERAGPPGDADNDESGALPIVVEHEL